MPMGIKIIKNLASEINIAGDILSYTAQVSVAGMWNIPQGIRNSIKNGREVRIMQRYLPKPRHCRVM